MSLTCIMGIAFVSALLGAIGCAQTAVTPLTQSVRPIAALALETEAMGPHSGAMCSLHDGDYLPLFFRWI